MSTSSEPSAAPVSADPLARAAPAVDDVEARRARASIESRLFSGPPQPVRVGRYRIEGRIGAGGMGVVYRAHDPELARDVAVKLMNADTAGSKDPSTARARLVREARAMARLAHPNVLHVYDVGTTDDGVFIAMELVEGPSLARWIEQHSPPWTEILRRYVDAGRGLAAAHDAGVIHRDFKPENVLLGADGRVRVGDFGLAGGPAAIERTSADSELDRDTGDLHGPSGSLTKTGALLGTPKYMAPEQESGGAAGPGSDQFSFCVALYEALYGYPPFAGDSVAEYRRNVRQGQVLDPPPDGKVRAWIHAEIVRGLAVEPDDRHPGLAPLLDRLEQALLDPRVARRRRRVRALGLVGAAAALIAVGAGSVLLTRPDEPPPTSVASPATSPAAEPSSPEPSSPEPSSPDVVTMAKVPMEPGEPEASLPAVAAADTETDPTDQTHAPTDTDQTHAPTDTEQAHDAEQTGSAPASTPGPTPSAGSASPGTAATGDRPRSTRRKRDHGTCYFQQDRFNYLQRQRKHARFVTGQDGRCYDCQQPAPDYRRAQLSPDDCARYYLCVRTEQEQCTGG